jgi:hypothetical protein
VEYTQFNLTKPYLNSSDINRYRIHFDCRYVTHQNMPPPFFFFFFFFEEHQNMPYVIQKDTKQDIYIYNFFLIFFSNFTYNF